MWKKKLLVLLLLTCPALAKNFPIPKIKASFQVNAALSEARKVGLDAYMLELPDASGKNSQMDIVIARVGKGAIDNMARNNVKPFDYAKTAFLGLSTPPTGKKSRSFGASACEGEVTKTAIPRAAEVEAYFVPGPGGSMYLVAFRTYAGATDRAEEIRAQVAKSWKFG